MPTIVITGANRGIGLEFVQQYAADGAEVIAACRKPSEASALKAISGNVKVLECDVANEKSVTAFARDIGEAPVDILINNAGVGGREAATFGTLDFDAWRRTFDVNAMGPAMIIAAFLDNIRAGNEKKIINISSNLGGITEASGGHYAYRASKAALNMMTKAMSEDLKHEGVAIVSFHPGWVQTDMGGASATLPAEESVRVMRQVIAGLKQEDSGKFLKYTGDTLAY